IEYDSDFENFSEEPKKLVESLNKESEKGEWGSMDFTSMSGGFELFVYADNEDDLKATSDQVEEILNNTDGLEAVESDLTEAYDQYTFVTDQQRLAELGLTTAQIGMALNEGNQGAALTSVKHDGETLDVFVAVEEKEFGTFESLETTEV